MAPLLVPGLALAFGLVGYELYKKKHPAVQVQSVTGTGGVPLQIVTPVASYVTPNQARGIPTPPAPSPAPHIVAPAVAQTVPGQGTVYAPPKMVDVASPGQLQLAPVIISPTGASSVAIGTTLDVQKALNTLGYVPRLQEDGKLGPRTIANIRQFQSKSGLTVDGSAGPATKAALSGALAGFVAGGPTAPVALAASKTPSPNMSARDVQHALNLIGAKPPLKEDGKVGPMTVAAIKSFQLTHGLTVDGVAGPKTKAALAIAIGAVTPQVSGEFG